MVAKPNINGTARSERIKYDALFVIGSGIFFSPGATPPHERQLDGQWGRHGGGGVCARVRECERGILGRGLVQTSKSTAMECVVNCNALATMTPDGWRCCGAAVYGHVMMCNSIWPVCSC